MDGKPLRPRLPPPPPPPGWVDTQEQRAIDPFLLKLIQQQQQHRPLPPPPRPPPGPFKLARSLYEEQTIDNDRTISPDGNGGLTVDTPVKKAVVIDPFLSRKPPDRRRGLPHRAAAAPLPKETVTKRFRFRSRIVCASGAQSDPSHPNVLRLTIRPSLVERLVRVVISLVVPAPLRARLAAYFPEWYLPARVVVKKHKTGWDEEFAAEKAAYSRLKPLQGVVVPEYYGEVVVDGGVPAILLSAIGGACLAAPEGALLDAQAELRPRLDAALAALARLGVVQSDVKPDNFHLVDDRVMMVDLEVVNVDLADEQSTRLTRSIVERIVYFYEQNQLCFLEDGLIVAGDV